MATDSDDPSFPSPNKRCKTLSPTSKSKIEEEPNHQESQQWTPNPSPCMICLSDGGKSMRGKIDCCDHYFCFLCIMEWAKIESRCPICKRRFTTIRRLFNDSVQRVLKVPVRDQVSPISDNLSISYIYISEIVLVNLVLISICKK
jgi:hypothetical protein